MQCFASQISFKLMCPFKSGIASILSKLRDYQISSKNHLLGPNLNLEGFLIHPAHQNSTSLRTVAPSNDDVNLSPSSRWDPHVGQNGKNVLVRLVGKPRRGAPEDRCRSTDGGQFPTWKFSFLVGLSHPQFQCGERLFTFSLLPPLHSYSFPPIVYSHSPLTIIIVFLWNHEPNVLLLFVASYRRYKTKVDDHGLT